MLDLPYFTSPKYQRRSRISGPDTVNALSKRASMYGAGVMFGLAFNATAGTPASSCVRNAGGTLSDCSDWEVQLYMPSPWKAFDPVLVTTLTMTPPTGCSAGVWPVW